ncbi:MAG: pyrimidine dimer DNA glycosylase/endonuclease V [archaeon]
MEIFNILTKRTKIKGWRNHPVVKMWEGHTNALKFYFNKSLEEWISPGYKNNMVFENIQGKIIFPKWFGNRKFHSSHKSNLLRKDKKYYSKFKWKESSDLPFVWPKNK